MEFYILTESNWFLCKQEEDVVNTLKEIGNKLVDIVPTNSYPKEHFVVDERKLADKLSSLDSLNEKEINFLTEKLDTGETYEVDSSNVDKIIYYTKQNALEIKFHSGGKYKYFDVPQEIVDNLLEADSCGSYYHNHIKGKYQSKKIK